MGKSICNKCGAIQDDLDVGFSLATQGMSHGNCGGKFVDYAAYLMGQKKTEKKAASSKANGKLGGRPRGITVDGSEKYSLNTKLIPINGVLSVHIPWPTYYIGEYGSGMFDGSPVAPAAADRVMDRYIAEHVSIPEGIAITSIIAGRAYRGKTLTPCIVISVASSDVVEEISAKGGSRVCLGARISRWFDGLKAH